MYIEQLQRKQRWIRLQRNANLIKLSVGPIASAKAMASVMKYQKCTSLISQFTHLNCCDVLLKLRFP